MQLKKCTPLNQYPKMIKKKSYKINEIKTQHKERKKYKPASSILLCSFAVA